MNRNIGGTILFVGGLILAFLLGRHSTVGGHSRVDFKRGDVIAATFMQSGIAITLGFTVTEVAYEQNGTQTVYALQGTYPDTSYCTSWPAEEWIKYGYKRTGHVELPESAVCQGV
jgi:hypothetical protein